MDINKKGWVGARGSSSGGGGKLSGAKGKGKKNNTWTSSKKGLLGGATDKPGLPAGKL